MDLFLVPPNLSELKLLLFSLVHEDRELSCVFELVFSLLQIKLVATNASTIGTGSEFSTAGQIRGFLSFRSVMSAPYLRSSVNIPRPFGMTIQMRYRSGRAHQGEFCSVETRSIICAGAALKQDLQDLQPLTSGNLMWASVSIRGFFNDISHKRMSFSVFASTCEKVSPLSLQRRGQISIVFVAHQLLDRMRVSGLCLSSTRRSESELA